VKRGTAISKTFHVGDHVRWNSEAGRVSGVIIEKITADTKVKGYVHHASREAPQYLIKSDKTDHIVIHKSTALRLSRRLEENPTNQNGEETIAWCPRLSSIPNMYLGA
jgi:Hypervirulence associated proteins TUDOR domain